MSQGSVYYPDYLKLDTLLNAQGWRREARAPRTTNALHRDARPTSSGFKQVLHEVGSVMAMFADEHVDDNGGS